MRYFLVLVVVLLGGMIGCQAVDLFQQVPGKDPAYFAMRHLDHCKFFPQDTANAQLHARLGQRSLTNYDFAFALTEPLKQFIALADIENARASDAAQKQRGWMLHGILSELSATEREQVITEVKQLTTRFAEVIEQFQPGLLAQALDALRRLSTTRAISARTAAENGAIPDAVTFSFNPNATQKTGLLPSVVVVKSPTALAMTGSTDSQPIAMYPVKTWEFALNSTLRGVGVQASFSTLPGTNPLDVVSSLQMPGLWKVGVTTPDLLRFGGMGFRWMIDYHIQRYPDQGIINTQKAVATGMQIVW